MASVWHPPQAIIPSTLVSQALTLDAFQVLSELLQSIVADQLSSFFVLTEANLLEGNLTGVSPIFNESCRFTLVISASFSALICGIVVPVAEGDQPICQLALSFQPAEINNFYRAIYSHLNSDILSQLTSQLTSLFTEVSSPREILPLEYINCPKKQSEFTADLINILATNQMPAHTNSIPSQLHDDLIYQENLLKTLTSQIYQSRQLKVIFATVLEQVQNLLQCDRLLIYQLSPEKTAVNNLNNYIAYESLGKNRQIQSILHEQPESSCFEQLQSCWQKYQQGFILAISDIQDIYHEDSCLFHLMQKYQVRAKLVVPMVVQDQLWGLLIAHQCEQRVWLEQEKNFLRQVAEHLAIAIYQNQLYSQLQEQKESLEKLVAERTQNLYDALQSAELASRTKSEFLANMSHELRTPLTCVIGVSATLIKWSFGPEQKSLPPAKQLYYLQTIYDSGKNLLEVINAILDMSELEAGKSVLNISRFSISQLMETVIDNFDGKAIAKGINLIIDNRLVPGQDQFTGDPRRIEQVCNNLVSNAIKFTAPEGDVKLRVWREPHNLIVQVEDTGVGIAKEQKSLLFTKFQQLDSPYIRQYGGTGLGLAIVKQLVGLHGGVIEVESQVDIGSVFTIRLPCQTEISTEHHSDKGLVANTHSLAEFNCSIILIEEDEDTAEIICDVLTEVGLKVIWLGSHPHSIEQIVLFQPLVVIIEISSSHLNGYEIIEQLRLNPLTQQIKILAIMTEENSTQAKEQVMEKIDGFLIKPIDLQDLLNKITILYNPAS
jgi:two-component system sensor histidine kinase/response regulator